MAPSAKSPPAVEAGLATELVELLGRPLSDDAVKAVLGRAGLPVGTKIDKQANPALGVSYLGTKFPIDGKATLGIDEVCFYAAKQTAYIRGLGAEVELAGYPGALPHGLVLGSSRAAVATQLGPPETASDDYDHWQLAKDRVIACEFARGKLVMVRFGRTR